jgi:flavin-dependent dehydrogenase
MAYDFDFAVAGGGGPAGCAAAITLAQRGHSVVLFGATRFRASTSASRCSPRRTITSRPSASRKESTPPGFRKNSARLLTHDGQNGRGVRFADAQGVRRPQTYQVPRAEFDRILLERAREVGVDVREGVRVTGCEFTSDAAMIDIANGTASRVRVRAMVDATGRNGLIARKFNLRTDEPLLANIAIYSHYSNVPRLPDGCPNDIRIIRATTREWFWLIPISAQLMSVGVVLPRTLFLQMPDGTPGRASQSGRSRTRRSSRS